MKMPIRLTLAVLSALALLAVPSAAGAASPANGNFRGPDGVNFRVGLVHSAGATVRHLTYESHQYGTVGHFEEAFIVDGSFETCAEIGITRYTNWRRYCLTGHFNSPLHATGHVRIFEYVSHPFSFRPLPTVQEVATHGWSASISED